VLRTVDSHLGRIGVLTYQEFLDHTERALGNDAAS
jgi:hypothetical protein